jgi:coenzyme F420-0:L-glutamate ligase/coenzyme F420-1:gamma-L-glutamate ligase
MDDSGSSTVRIVGLTGLPEVMPGDDLVQLTCAALERAALDVQAGDVFVFTQKIVSKAEGRLVRLDEVIPSALARRWGERWARDPRVIHLALDEASRIVRMDRGVVITETHHGFVCANSGVDTSNVAPGEAALLPLDPDASARRLCEALRRHLQQPVGVVISDTFGRPWREGQVNVAIGVAGLRPIADYRGVADARGQLLRSTAIAIADEIASAAELVMGKTRGVPVAIVQGTGVGAVDIDAGCGRDLRRARADDLFR